MAEPDLERVATLLEVALERAPENRPALLDRECGQDEALRRDLEELLSIESEAADYFDGLAREIASSAVLEVESAARPRLLIGPYQTLESIGHGGMGAVYRAERVDGAFDHHVAVKLLHRDMDTPQLRARFLAERQLLARLSHPNIAHLLDGGVTDERRPYFVMEHVDGIPITRYCERHALAQEQVLRLFLRVIDAVSYLHRNLVVHRDLKPSNILVDRAGQAKLLDFGIAKLLAEAPGEGDLTGTGERLMTPEYAAPEQLLGAPVTTATDVYALGVVLYELLTGCRPHPRRSPDDPTGLEALPPTPSSRLRSRHRSAAQTTDPGAAAESTRIRWRRIDHDLDRICLAALRPEPEARYASAEQLGQDIERFLEGLPIRARQGTLGYRAGKFVRRHRSGLAVAVALLVILSGGFARERRLRREAELARSQAQLQAARAEATSDFLGSLLSSANPMKAQGRELTVADVLDQASGRLSTSDELRDQPEVEATVRDTLGIAYTALGKYSEAREHLERSVELRGGLVSRDPEALAAIDQLGVLYSRLGLAEAEPMLRRALDGRVVVFGEDHPLVMTSLNHLADLYWDQGRFDEVEAIDRRTLGIRLRLFGEDHPDTLKSLNGLAGTLFTRGRYDEAAEIYERARDSARRLLGDNHPHTLVLGSNLAAAYLELGRYADAAPLLEEISPAQSQVFGADHPQTAVSLHNLGVVLAMQARYPEAEEQLRRATEIRARLPAGERSMSTSQSHLADVIRDQGHLAEAEALYLETLKLQGEVFGPADGETLRTRAALLDLRIRQGRLAAADELASGLLEAVTEARGSDHPDAVGVLTLLARIRNEQGRPDEALELATRASETGGRALGDDHPVVLEAEIEQARALISRHELGAALELVERVHDIRSGRLGDGHPETLEAVRYLQALRASRDAGTAAHPHRASRPG